MRHSEQINEIAGALVKARGNFKPLSHDASNPFFHNTYASLGAVVASALPALLDEDIMVVQGQGFSDHTGAIITTRLIHKSGQWIETDVRMPLVGKQAKGGALEPVNPQSAGSALTYGRRYGLSAALGIVADNDDDGEVGSQDTRGQAERPRGAEVTNAPPKAQSSGPTKCPECQGKVWDNRAKKKDGSFKSSAPNYSCADRDKCGWKHWGETWPPKDQAKKPEGPPLQRQKEGGPPIDESQRDR